MLPRLLRWTGDSINLEDGAYAQNALLIARGYRPYLDFTQVAFPFAEQFLALLVRAFGPRIRLIEATTLALNLLTALLLFRAGTVLAGRRCGAVAAVLWSWSPWVAFYSNFERETPALIGVMTALVIALRPEPLRGRRLLLVAGALLFACLMKITLIMAALALVAHRLLCGRWREALALLALFLGGLALATFACWLVWGQPFLEQVWLYGVFRGRVVSAGGALGMVLNFLDPLSAAGFVGLILVGIPGLRRPVGAVALVLLFDLLFYSVVSPTFWAHNVLVLLPSLALLAGACAAQATRWRAAGRVLACGLFVLFAVWPTAESVAAAVREGLDPTAPAHVRAWGEPRAEILQMADFIERHSGPDDVVESTSSWATFEAGRLKFVRDWDLQSIAQGLHASLAADGLRATMAKIDGPAPLGAGQPGNPPTHPPKVWTNTEGGGLMAGYALRLLANDVIYVRPAYLQALARREIALVMEPLPAGVIEAKDLREAGYELVSEGFVAGWRPKDGPAPPRRLPPLFER